ncbi:DJ-1/PfpI family protein [Candidatus Woesearchaeota archaeon]|nr:DJ-1/PfpI family protein [Candidatus Woesearchaeota archaeon]
MKTILIIAMLFMCIFLTSCGSQVTADETNNAIGGGNMADLTGKKVVMIIAPENFRDEELLEPKNILENAGAEVTIASKEVQSSKGMLGAEVNVDIDYSAIDVNKYDAVIFIGGSGASIYFNDEKAHDLAKQAVAQGKLLGAICIAPSTLANAGVITGKKATCFDSEADNLRSKGVNYTGEDVTVDGKIITAKGPHAAKEFGNAIAENL